MVPPSLYSEPDLDQDRFVLPAFRRPLDAGVLPSLFSELEYLHSWRDLLQKRWCLAFPASGESLTKP